MTHKKGVLSRADLLAVLGDHRSTHWLADQLYLRSDFEQIEEDKEHCETQVCEAVLEQVSTAPQTITQIDDRLEPHFWYLEKREAVDLAAEDEQQVAAEVSESGRILQEDWRGRPQQAPQLIPLCEEKRLLATLKPFLKQFQATHKVDLTKLTKTISRGEVLKKIPKQKKRTHQRHLHIIDDRSRHLTPYWQDHNDLRWALMAAYQGQNISVSVLTEGERQPQQIINNCLAEWNCPANSLVLALSDLGALQAHRYQRQQTWKTLAQTLKAQHCSLLALTPCEQQKIPFTLQCDWQVLAWEQHQNKATAEQGACETLLTYLAPAIRIEPSLLRAMRLALNLPCAIESAAWQHHAIKAPHSTAATWEAEARKAYLALFEQLTDSEKTKALSLIRAWRQPLSKQVWYEECVSLTQTTQQLELIQQDSQQANAYFIALRHQLEKKTDHNTQQATQAWCRRLLSRLPEPSLDQSRDLQRIAAQVQKDNPYYDPKGINPQHLPLSQEAEKQAVIFQRGSRLLCQTYQPFDLPESGYSPLALIKCRHPKIQVKAGEQLLGYLELDQAQGIALPNQGALTLKSDQETLHLTTCITPEIASDMGRDRYGLFMDLELFGVIQRFRYIEPSVFMMGSPEDEVGRYKWEKQRNVNINKGYWLSDTACTKELWNGVMLESSDIRYDLKYPLDYRDISQVKDFFSKLNQAYSEIAATLPNEQQWENACRAGTKTPFHFGETISFAQVNHAGSTLLHRLPSSQVRSVKTYPPNRWGLFEMHGNVWEACIAAPVIEEEPVQLLNDRFIDSESTMLFYRPETHEEVVLCGGSWSEQERNCRSGVRSYHISSNTGFRIALSYDLPSNLVLRSNQDQYRVSDPAEKIENLREQTGTNSVRNEAEQDLGQVGNGNNDTMLKKVLNWVRGNK